jgi:urease beta subunit
VIPGEYVLGEGDVVANQGRRTVELTVTNTADRPIQVGSHFHAFEDKEGMQTIPAGGDLRARFTIDPRLEAEP